MRNSEFESRLNMAKEVNMVDLLGRLGIYPEKGQNPKARCVKYRSPLRPGEDRHASFLVHPYNHDACWIDMAQEKVNGDTVNFVMRYQGLSCSSAVDWILMEFCPGCATSPAGIRKNGNSSNVSGYSAQEVRDVSALKDEKLLSYMKSRFIHPDTASAYCKEVSYSYKGMEFKVIGFPNSAGGYVVRGLPSKNNPRGYKGDLKAKAISVFHIGETPSSCCLMFEGFMNMLSYVEIYGQPDMDVIILNGKDNSRQLDRLVDQGVTEIFFYRDNDDAGKTAFDIARDRTGCTVRDCSECYASLGLNDMNEYLAYWVKSGYYHDDGKHWVHDAENEIVGNENEAEEWEK